jgi:glutamyl-tRNA reductase
MSGPCGLPGDAAAVATERPAAEAPPEDDDPVVDRARERALRLAARERREAESKLAARGDLTDRQRETLAALADALATDLVAARAATRRHTDDADTRRALARLFDPDGRPGDESI